MAVQATLARTAAVTCEWTTGTAIGRSEWSPNAALETGYRVADGAALFVLAKSEATCTLCLTNPMVTCSTDSVTCNPAIKLERIPLSWLPSPSFGDRRMVLFVPPSAISDASSVVLSLVKSESEGAVVDVLQFASLSRMLINCVLASDATVTLETSGGCTLIFRVCRYDSALIYFYQNTIIFL